MLRILIDYNEFIEDLTYSELGNFVPVPDSKYSECCFCLGPVDVMTSAQMDEFDVIITKTKNPLLMQFVRRGGILA